MALIKSSQGTSLVVFADTWRDNNVRISRERTCAGIRRNGQIGCRWGEAMPERSRAREQASAASTTSTTVCRPHPERAEGDSLAINEPIRDGRLRIRAAAAGEGESCPEAARPLGTPRYH